MLNAVAVTISRRELATVSVTFNSTGKTAFQPKKMRPGRRDTALPAQIPRSVNLRARNAIKMSCAFVQANNISTQNNQRASAEKSTESDR